MTDVILTGATGGIGAALAVELARRDAGRLVLSGRDAAALARVTGRVAAASSTGRRPTAIPADLSTRAGARALGEALARDTAPGSVLIHNAGVWPAKLERTEDGLERAFAVNHVAPLVVQAPLLAAGALARVLVIGAGLMDKGRFDAERTPTGADFGSIRTYCTTKLGGALAMRDVAAAHPEVDVAVVHPGVVRTALGDRGGPLGVALALAKRRWEAPEVCARRLADLLARPRWSAADGDAAWFVEADEQPWPAVAQDPDTRAAVAAVTARLL